MDELDGVIELDGDELAVMLAALSCPGVRRLRVHTDGTRVRFKINECMWSAPLGTPSKNAAAIASGCGPVCSECGETRGEHHADTMACPVFAAFDPDCLAGFHASATYVPLIRVWPAGRDL